MVHLAQNEFSYKKLCDSCGKKNCCTDFAEPMLFPSDLDRLTRAQKLTADIINEVVIEDTSIKTLKRKTNSNTCVFWDEDKKICSIYENRPFDCRMFPFDIEWANDEYHWIIYSCNPNSDWSWCEQHLKKLEADPQFSEVIKNIELFRVTSKNYLDVSKEPPYAVLRKVKENNSR